MSAQIILLFCFLNEGQFKAGFDKKIPFDAQPPQNQTYFEIILTQNFWGKGIFKIITRNSLIAMILFLKSNLCIAMTGNTGI